VSGSDAAMKLLGVARAKLRTTFRPRFELRVPRFFFDLRFVAAKVAAVYAECGYFGKAKFAISGEHRPLACSFRQLAGNTHANLVCGWGRDELGGSLCSLEIALRAAHVRAGAGVDLDQFAFLDEKRHVDGLAGFELRRLGDITGGIAAQTFR